MPRHLPAGGRSPATSSRRPCDGRRSGPSGRSTHRGLRASSASGSRRAGPTPSCAGARSKSSSRSPFDGFALGGLAVGESRERDARLASPGRLRAPGGAAALLHGHRRRGGDPRGRRARDRHVRLRPADADGADRVGAHGERPAQPPQRPLRARPAPARGGCGCPACTGFSRAFVRHLVTQQEILGLRLLTLHNLWFALD